MKENQYHGALVVSVDLELDVDQRAVPRRTIPDDLIRWLIRLFDRFNLRATRSVAGAERRGLRIRSLLMQGPTCVDPADLPPGHAIRAVRQNPREEPRLWRPAPVEPFDRHAWAIPTALLLPKAHRWFWSPLIAAGTMRYLDRALSSDRTVQVAVDVPAVVRHRMAGVRALERLLGQVGEQVQNAHWTVETLSATAKRRDSKNNKAESRADAA